LLEPRPPRNRMSTCKPNELVLAWHQTIKWFNYVDSRLRGYINARFKGFEFLEGG